MEVGQAKEILELRMKQLELGYGDIFGLKLAKIYSNIAVYKITEDGNMSFKMPALDVWMKVQSNEENGYAVGVLMDGEIEIIKRAKFTPRKMESYCYIDIDTLSVYNTSFYFNDEDDTSRINIGNCWRTADEAKVVLEKIKQLFQE